MLTPLTFVDDDVALMQAPRGGHPRLRLTEQPSLELWPEKGARWTPQTQS